MKIIIFFVALGIIVGFFIAGLPYLKTSQVDIPDEDFEEQGVSPGGIRTSEFVITHETLCQDFYKAEYFEKCFEDQCDQTCQTEGCAFYGDFTYNGSRFENDLCTCICFENVYKRLNPLD